MRILLSGSSGFIGSEVFSYLRAQKCEVVCLKRGDPYRSSADSIFWDPNLETNSPDFFEGFDAVIHLAGDPILGLWTKKKKQRILSSRVQGTKHLAQIFTRVKTPPKVFVSASAIGYYGDCGDEWLTESSSAGKGFLSTVCAAWESSTSHLQKKGIRVVNTRFGIVLNPEGGMLAKMILPFKYGLGCILGQGQQWISWIDRKDLVRALFFCVREPSLEGAVNCVSPNPIRQQELAKWLAHHFRKPLFLRLPAWLLRTLLGQMADEMLLASQRVKPTKLLQHNFSFETPTLEGVFDNEHFTYANK